MRRVFSSHKSCAEAWAHRRQDHGTTSRGRVFFENETVFSYGRHFPLARFVNDANGCVQVLVNELRYSSSTSKHQCIVRRALYGAGWRTSLTAPFYVGTHEISGWNPDRLDKSSAKVLAYYFGKIKGNTALWEKARARKSWYEETVLGLVSEARRFCSCFNLPEGFPDDIEGVRLYIALNVQEAA